ncbi:Hypothetical predicted protein [Olea europaea subsp. europaea]|uniref:Uncharacterized protein n=1 Tax=Olea europaea subsp. europaea TaxID=158383 RepID=A0A8S0PMN0_OLEEU|nr:Hypothetical predicted protein [Olea europaea subsp. europaea]
MVVPSSVAGEMEHSSSSSGIYFQTFGQSQVAGNALFSSKFGNSSKLIHGNACSNGDLASGDVSNTVSNSVASSTPSIRASSLVTDANSGLSGGPHLRRNSSFNTESHMRLPASPLSFSSNNISVSGSSVMDGSSIAQQSFNQDPSSQQTQRSQQHHGASSATSLPISRMEHVQLLGDPMAPSSYIHDSSCSSTTASEKRSHAPTKPQSSYANFDSTAEAQATAATAPTVHASNAAGSIAAATTAGAAAAVAVKTAASTTGRTACIYIESPLRWWCMLSAANAVLVSSETTTLCE